MNSVPEARANTRSPDGAKTTDCPLIDERLRLSANERPGIAYELIVEELPSTTTAEALSGAHATLMGKLANALSPVSTSEPVALSVRRRIVESESEVMSTEPSSQTSTELQSVPAKRVLTSAPVATSTTEIGLKLLPSQTTA